MSYDTYIFDLDGTLLDTLADLHASVNYALRSTGMPERSLEEVRTFVGNGVRLLMERAVPDGTDNVRFDEAYQQFRSHYLIHSQDSTCPYPGIMDTLQTLHDDANRLLLSVISSIKRPKNCVVIFSVNWFPWPLVNERGSGRNRLLIP